MPHYYFDIKDGHGLVDPSGLEFKNDDATIAKARVLAIGVSLDKPAVEAAHCCFKWITRENFYRARLFQTNNEHHVGIRKIIRT
jgi:hypothetical protein